jgi:hypothetical protein
MPVLISLPVSRKGDIFAFGMFRTEAPTMESTRDEAAVAQLKLRIREPLRAAIERDAEIRGISMNAVISERLEHSFRADDGLGGPRVSALLRILADAIRLSGAGPSDQWLDDPARRRAVFAFLKRHLDLVHVEMAEKEQNTLENILGQVSLAAIDDREYSQELARLHYKHIWHLRSDEERKRYCAAVERITGLPASELEGSL